MTLLQRALLLLALPVALVSCADDGGSSSGGSGSPGGTATLTGSVVKGVTRHAVVTITDAAGNLLATTESSDLGAYSVNLPEGFNGAVHVLATAKQNAASLPPEQRTQMRCDALSGCWDADENAVAFGDWFEVPLDFEMSAVMSVSGWGIQLANVTPLSTLAANWAATFPQGLTTDVANDANARVAAMFGLALSDLEDDTNDIADPLWLQMASPKQVQLALLYATFAELHGQYHEPMQQMLIMLSDYFVGQGGALMQGTTGPAPSIGFLTDLAEQILHSSTVAGVIDVPGGSYSDVQSALDTLQSGLVVDQLSNVQPVTWAELRDTMGPMGQQIDELLTLSGLLNTQTGEVDLQQFIDAQWPHFQWLAAQDNLDLMPVAAEAAVQAVMATFWLDIVAPGVTDVVMLGSIKDESDEYGQTYIYKINLNVPTRTLTFVGNTRGQTVNLTLGLTGFMDAMQHPNQRFEYSIAGTVANETASGVIDAELTVDAKNVDFGPMIAALQPIATAQQSGNQSALMSAMLSLLTQMPALLNTYAYSLDVEAWANGTATLVRNDDPTQTLSGNFDVHGFVDLGATGKQKLVQLDLINAELVLPSAPGQVNHFYPDHGKHVFKLDMAQDLDVTINGAGQAFGIPESILAATGKVTGARLLFDHVRSTLLTGAVSTFQALMGTGSVDFEALIADLLDFDFDQLHASGDARITIAALNHDYHATLNDLLVTLYQPNSNRVAATAELRPAQQKIHFELGAHQEPWDLRVMTTPTPRLVLLGPSGQYAEMTQEDVYALLDTLQLPATLDEFIDGLFDIEP